MPLRLIAPAAAVLALLAPAHASAGSVTALNLTGYADMVVDDAHQHVFVTGRAGDSSVIVLDYSGVLLTTITNEPGAAGMALDTANDTLYVALSSSNGISAIDTTTLAESARISIAPASAATKLALAGGRLWFAHDCSGTTSNF